MDELKLELKKIFSEFTAEYCEKLVMSMPRRIEVVLKNEGYRTKY